MGNRCVRKQGRGKIGGFSSFIKSFVIIKMFCQGMTNSMQIMNTKAKDGDTGHPPRWSFLCNRQALGFSFWGGEADGSLAARTPPFASPGTGVAAACKYSCYFVKNMPVSFCHPAGEASLYRPSWHLQGQKGREWWIERGHTRLGEPGVILQFEKN